MDALYIHIPFCNKKCNYCDFWTFINMDHEFDFYTKNIIEEIKQFGYAKTSISEINPILF